MEPPQSEPHSQKPTKPEEFLEEVANQIEKTHLETFWKIIENNPKKRVFACFTSFENRDLFPVKCEKVKVYEVVKGSTLWEQIISGIPNFETKVDWSNNLAWAVLVGRTGTSKASIVIISGPEKKKGETTFMVPPPNEWVRLFEHRRLIVGTINL